LILVTGASGFIGRNLIKVMVDQLYDFEIRAASRCNSTLFDNKVEKAIVPCVDSNTYWDDALFDVECVIHLAAIAHNNDGDPYSVNVEGTENLARQAAKFGVKRFIFISTIGVYGANNIDNYSEDSKKNPHNIYSESKLIAEEKLKKICQECEMEYVIIRPPLVYGGNAPGNFASLVKFVDLLPLLPFGMIKNQRSIISINNLCDFIIHAINHPFAANEEFVVADEFDVSIKDLTNAIAKGIHKTRWQVPVPETLLRLITKAIGKQGYADQLLGSLRIDSSKARCLLGWIPPENLDSALAELRTITSEKL